MAIVEIGIPRAYTQGMRNSNMSAIDTTNAYDGTPEARVITLWRGTVDTTIKTYRGRGCVARAAKYIRDNAFCGELVDLFMLRQIERETFDAYCK